MEVLDSRGWLVSMPILFVQYLVNGVIDLKLFLKTSNEGILSRGTWVTFAALRQSSIWPTTSPHLLFYVLLLSLQEKKTQKQKAKT